MKASKEMSAGQLMVLEMELSTWRCSAACISRCARGVSSSAVTKACVSGAPGAEHLAEEGVRVVLDRLGARGAVALQHAALVAEVEHRLDAGGDVAGEQRDGAGRRDGGEEAVADAVAARSPRAPPRAGAARSAPPGNARRRRAGRRPSRARARRWRDRRRARSRPSSSSASATASRRAVARAGEDQRVGEAGDAEADAALGLGLLLLRRGAG